MYIILKVIKNVNNVSFNNALCGVNHYNILWYTNYETFDTFINI